MLDSFHWLKLQYLIGKKFPHVISNVNLCKRCKSYPISLVVPKARWKLFGHVLRLDETCPAKAAMEYYFEETGSKHYRGWPGTTIVTTLQEGIECNYIGEGAIILGQKFEKLCWSAMLGRSLNFAAKSFC